MKHQWRLHRQLEPMPDGQQRWDRAYQQILRWSSTASMPNQSAASSTQPEGVTYAGSSICSSVDLAADPGPDD